MSRRSESGGLAAVSVSVADESDAARVLEAYALLQEALGDLNVEDLESFKETVSAGTDSAVVPKMVYAIHRGRIQGVVLGAHLSNLNIGMVLYSAVRESFRRRGIYAALRARLVALLAIQAADSRRGPARERPVGLDYMVSELESESWLALKYVCGWGAFSVPCEYWQPDAQGLAPRKMDLVIQPMARRSPPTEKEIVAIVREIYERIYRLGKADGSAHFRRVVQSLQPGLHPLTLRAAVDSPLEISGAIQ